MRQTLLMPIQKSKVLSNLRIIYHLLFIIFYLFVSAAPAAAQIQMRDVFAAMPDSLLPLVTKNNRLDCIDFIENNMEARVRNRLGEYVTLEALTADYARFRTSPSSFLELKLLPVDSIHQSSIINHHSSFILCLVTTIQTGEEGTSRRLEDSVIRFFTPDWHPLSEAPYTRPVDAGFLLMRLSPDVPTLTLTSQTALQTLEEREQQPAPASVVLRWNGISFVQE